MVQVPVLAIHGGAGTINREALSAEAEREYRGALQSILEKGRDALAAGASALDAVTLAVSMLEDCPLFNAGRGAVYTSAETHEMDAAIMDGSTLRTGALSCVHGVKNPIRAARVVMEQSPHVLMTSDGAMAFLREHGVEFMRYEPILHGRGLDVSDEGETSVPGLFAAGDLVGNGGCGIALAAYLGWEGGMAAAAQAATVDFQPAEETESIRKRMELLSSFMDRPEGADWKDANMALQQIMSDYAPAGPAKVRSETLLNAGRDYLKQLRHSAERQMGATCSHTLMRAAEVLDLMDCGEAIMNAALARQETRANHVRSDFPFTNPLLADKFLTVGLEGDEVVARWRPIRQPVSR